MDPAARVSLLGVRDSDFLRVVLPQLANPAQHRAAWESDHIFLAAESAQQLKRAAPLVKYLRPGGTLWILYATNEAALSQAAVVAALEAAGLQPGPTCSFNATQTAAPGRIPA